MFLPSGGNLASRRARLVKHAHATSRQDTPGFVVAGRC